MTLFLALILAPLALLTLCFAIELLVGIRPLPDWVSSEADKVTAAIIVPAHDEQSILFARLTALRHAAANRARILLVADNCSDSTAEIARDVGVDVIERVDPLRRGKGFALDFARQHLRSDPPNVILIIDADCTTDGQSIARLAKTCAASCRPCQAINLQRPALEASPAVQLSTFAFFIKNVIRQRAMQRIAGHGHLFGTGMAIPWSLFVRADLASDNIVEDLKLGVELASGGHGPLLVEDSIVWSDPETKTNTLSQRRRWEGGFLQNAVSTAPRMLVDRARGGDLRGMWAALDLMVPPFALLLTIDGAAMLIGAIILAAVGNSLWPLLPLLVSLLCAALGLSLAWTSGGRRFVTLRSLAQAPLYVVWKLPLYVGLAWRGAPTEWVRTRRREP